MATSSSDLKSGKSQRKDTVASRLSKAAKEAAAKKAIKDQDAKQLSASSSSSSKSSRRNNEDDEDDVFEDDDDHLSNITNLARVIDEELLRPRDGYRPPRESSSMRILLEHNDKIKDAEDKKKVPECRHVAIVFSKPLWQDQITTEYASRLASLARAMKHENYLPSLICFSGSEETTKKKQNKQNKNLVAATSAGVIFFRHLCTANQIDLDGTDLCIVQHDEDDDFSWSSSSLHSAVEELFHRHYLEAWLDQSQAFESKTDEYGLMRREPRKKIQIHWTLISTDYHLCNLNDIHVRSPRQSPLNTLVQELEQASNNYNMIVRNTWCFRYSTYPYVYSINELTAFLGKCYLLAQELRPLLNNIRGVAKQVSCICYDTRRRTAWVSQRYCAS
jgi:hypothetical protein